VLILSFLQRSRNAKSLPYETFTIGAHTKVTVHCAGVIEFSPMQPLDNFGHNENNDKDSNGDKLSLKSVIYSCGVHGNETAPIEICDALVTEILNESIIVKHRLMVQFANLPAMDIGQRFVSENMNRLFNGAHATSSENSVEAPRAALLEKLTLDFFVRGPAQAQRYHYDLHTAIRAAKYPRFVVYPYLHGRPYNQEQISWLAGAGIQAILLSESPTTTYSYYSSNVCQAHAFTVELGKVKPFGKNNMQEFTQAKDFLFNLATTVDYKAPPVSIPVLYKIKQSIMRNFKNFTLHFSDDTPNFTTFKQGSVLASEYEDTKSESVEYTVQLDEEAIVFPNADVALGQRALLTLEAIQTDDILIE